MILLNDEKRKIGAITGYKELCITSTLKTGDKELTFAFRKNNPYADSIREEAYIKTRKDEFVIKQIDDGDEWQTCTAQLNVEELQNKQFPAGFTTTEQTIITCITAAVEGTGWAIAYCEITKKRTIKQEQNCSAWDVIQSCISTYRCEIKFDSINKSLWIYEKIGEEKGAYFIERLNLKKIQVQSNSYDFCTRLIPIGKDNLMIDIDGKNYIENYQYSKKIKTATWKDERYTVIESLLEDAEAKLEELSKPYKSYTTEINDLAAANEEYKGFLSYDLGDIVRLISKSKKIKERHRIVKIYEYPDNPEKNKCELSNTKLSFEELQKQEQELQAAEITAAASEKAAETVNETITDLEAIKQIAGQIQTAVETNIEADIKQQYSTKAETTAAISKAGEYTDSAIEAALQSYLTMEKVIKTVNEAIAQDNITDNNTYATKKELADAQNEAQKAANNNTDIIYWLVEKLGLQSDFEDQF